jgi:hypothetical protein
LDSRSNVLDLPRWELWRDVNWPTDTLTIRATAQNTDKFTLSVDLAVMPIGLAGTPHPFDQMQRQQNTPDDAGPIAFNLSSVPMAVW